MYIEPRILSYLKGEAFETNLIIRIGKEKHRPTSRENAIVNIIKEKSVIHIGCSDHIQLINQKISNNTWLHKLLTDNAKRCIGIDIDKESIEFIKKELGFTNVCQGNILTDDFTDIKNDQWDYVVLGEIIEHIDDPVSFLKVFKTRFGDNVNGFIITVPNIYNKRQFKNMMRYREVINSDHRYWFTPYTISKILVRAGYNPEKLIYSNLQSLNKVDLIKRKLKRLAGIEELYPFYYFSTIIITGSIN